MSDISKRGEALAAAHPLGEVLENAFLGVFHHLGRTIGYTAKAVSWALFHSYTLLFVIWLAFHDGFKHATKAKEEAPAEPDFALQQQLLADPRYNDQNTPFGVPYGPNVHASHE
jgi:hypothetical protein